MKRLVLVLGGALLTLVAGCATSHNVNVAPIQVAPIRMTMDVNVNVHESSGGDDEGVPDAAAEADAGAGGGEHARTERGRSGSTGG